MKRRIDYWRRTAKAYLTGANSHLTFWHETPEAQPGAVFDRLGPYYMSFRAKAGYPGPFDDNGIPMLDYHGAIGVQYNPIAIAQYGLARYNRFLDSKDPRSRAAFLRQADWLVEHLTPGPRGPRVWNHHFDFDYRQTLRAPWYSGLAQGQGVSLLARAHRETKDPRYAQAMEAAFEAMTRSIPAGGVLHLDPDGGVWIEEYIVDPPSHILNGFLWALWGVHDYRLATGEPKAAELFRACAETLARSLRRYDTGYWSLYELSDTRLPMLASPFYHRLHVVQLEITARMTGNRLFGEFAETWEGYQRKGWNRARSLAQKCLFKVLYY